MRALNKLQEYRTFMTQAAREPSTVGAVLPTSRHVARAVADVVPATGSPTVLELGPGTGALSNALHQRIPAGSRHVAIEIDPELVRYLRSAKPWLQVLEGDATYVRELLEPHGITEVDAVISSIPWTLLEPQKQREVLAALGEIMAPTAVFTTVTYLTTLWRANTIKFVDQLEQSFEEVTPRAAVWRNAPPARVYICRRPKAKLTPPRR